MEPLARVGRRGSGVRGRSAPAQGRPILIPCGNLSDAVTLSLTLGRTANPEFPVMRQYPPGLERRCEQRWAADFVAGIARSAPKPASQQQQLSEPAKAKRKNPAGLKRRLEVCTGV